MRHNKVGWLKSHRKMQFNELYQEKPFDRWHAWEHLLINAEHTERDVETKKGTVHLVPGQVLLGERDFAYEVGWTREKVRAFIATIKRTKMVTIERTTKGTILTIVNWDKYQYEHTNEDTNEHTAKHTNEHTVYKKYKNYKKEKEVCVSAPTPTPSLDDVKDYCRERGFTHVDADKFWNFYESKNWMEGGQVIGWKQRLAYWEAKDIAKEDASPKKEHIDSDDIRDIVAGVMKKRGVTNDTGRDTGAGD